MYEILLSKQLVYKIVYAYLSHPSTKPRKKKKKR